MRRLILNRCFIKDRETLEITEISVTALNVTRILVLGTNTKWSSNLQGQRFCSRRFHSINDSSKWTVTTRFR